MFIRKNKVYYVKGKDLGLSKGHSVIVVKRHLFSNKVDVRTITSLEHPDSKSKTGYRYDFPALNQAKKGEIIPIPINDINTAHYSGINVKNTIRICASKLRKNNLGHKYPKRFKKSISK